ncbi:MAG: glutathione peroxidase [Phenylobacterium sp.]|uniref:glutathione peroxidase n=1 Tax=unclassified Phenylobacterium TaxID=2640670 RepID=UPI0008C8E269|nr:MULTISPECIES: glutathione peroxidase [unclassified Phenylobacterium]MBJ7409051.1 glutathione peroxidase [Phenylobacterium sp.]OHB27867.1 MAG: glutathione peroxidase [Phenylobacterium sp. RIFCSPHIGHO2_01_FULL_69_31]
MPSAHDFTFDKISGGELPLSTFKDKAVLVVNTASKCGLTPQYDGLEKLYSDYKDKGLVVLGVPCNQFMGQEPGTEAEIETFCSTTFGIDFPMTGKVDVKGDDAHPFYKWAEQQLGEPAVPVWNFHKILIGKNGEAIRAFGPRTEPLDGEVTRAIEAAL